jgi:hypothetical protein
MTQAAHTPGPWAIEDPMGPDSLWIVQASKPTHEWFPIAVCNMPDEDDHLFTSANVNANIRLIAAAPELLAALKSVLPKNVCLTNRNVPDRSEVEFTITMGELRAIAAAIAKAEAGK